MPEQFLPSDQLTVTSSQPHTSSVGKYHQTNLISGNSSIHSYQNPFYWSFLRYYFIQDGVPSMPFAVSAFLSNISRMVFLWGDCHWHCKFECNTFIYFLKCDDLSLVTVVHMSMCSAPEYVSQYVAQTNSSLQYPLQMTKNIHLWTVIYTFKVDP